MFTKSWSILEFDKHIVYSKQNIGDEGCNYKFNYLFLMCGVWLNMGIIQCTYNLFITIAHHWAWLSMKFGFFQPIKFDDITYLICFGCVNWTFFELTKVDVIARSHNNEGVVYAFLNKVFSMFNALIKIIIKQGMKLYEEFQ